MKKRLLSILCIVSLFTLCLLSYLGKLKSILYSLIFSFNVLCSSLSHTLVLVKGVPLIYQKPSLPTGCEATSLAMLLQYHQVDISKTDVATALPKAPMPFEMKGKKVSLHPSEAFIGDPFTDEGYGVYLPPVLDLLEAYLPNQSINLSHSHFSNIISLLDAGIPVMAWVTIDMKEPRRTHTWETSSGPFTWLAPEHALVIVGYDRHYIYTHDPLNGPTIYPIETFKSSWEAMGKQALAIQPHS